MKNIVFVFLCLGMLVVNGFGQISDTIKPALVEKQKKGWNFGLLPAIAFDADIGFKYGAIVNAFNYSDGSRYPKYDHNIYGEYSRSSKGNRTAIFAYDSERLISKWRFSMNVQYLTEKALDFYGFNGNKAYYNHEYEDKESPLYKSRMFYRIERKFLMVLADFQKNIYGNKLKTVLGLNYYDNKIGSVDINRFNKNKDADDLLPSLDSVPGLYENYIAWDVLPKNELNGGKTSVFKVGLIYDSRDNEPNPMKGIWSEVLILLAPGTGKDFNSYSQLAMTHRHYFTIKKDIINLACRISYQTRLTGNMPFYMLPLVHYSNKPTRDGLGGARSVRGVKRNRIVGNGMAYGNMELRWKIFRGVIGGQNVYVAWSGFCDGGLVTEKYYVNIKKVPPNELYLLNNKKETIHLSYGTGIHIAMNSNFIVAFDYGVPQRKSDGAPSLYINLDFMF